MTTVFNPFRPILENIQFSDILLDSYNSDDNTTVFDVLDKIINFYNSEENKNSSTLHCSFTDLKLVKPEENFVIKPDCKLYYDSNNKTILEAEDISLNSINEKIKEEDKKKLQQIKFKDIFLNKEAEFKIKTNKNLMIRVHYNGQSKLLSREHNFLCNVVQKFDINLYPCEISVYNLNSEKLLTLKDIQGSTNISDVYLKRNTEFCEHLSTVCNFGFIFVKDLANTTLMIHVNYDSTVSELKLDIYHRSNVLPIDQILTFSGRELEDICILRDYKIFDRKTILLKSVIDINSKQYVTYFRGEVFVKGLNGKTSTFEVEFDQTISELKQMIQKKLDIDPDDQRLIFTGSQLENQKSLREYKLEIYSTIHLCLKLRGGMHHEISSRINNKGVEVNDLKLYCLNSPTNEIIKLELTKGIHKCQDVLTLINQVRNNKQV